MVDEDLVLIRRFLSNSCAILTVRQMGTALEILSEIRNTEVMAAGRSVHIRRYLERTYGRGRWRKMKGLAIVCLADGTICEAEIHWFEAHGIGRKDFKIKRVIR